MFCVTTFQKKPFNAFTVLSLFLDYLVFSSIEYTEFSFLVFLRLWRGCGLMASALDSGDVLCSWAGHLTLTVLFSTQGYTWVPVN